MIILKKNQKYEPEAIYTKFWTVNKRLVQIKQKMNITNLLYELYKWGTSMKGLYWKSFVVKQVNRTKRIIIIRH